MYKRTAVVILSFSFYDNRLNHCVNYILGKRLFLVAIYGQCVVYTSLYTVGSGLYQRHVATKISKNEEWLALVQVFIATITLQLGKVDFDKEKSF